MPSFSSYENGWNSQHILKLDLILAGLDVAYECHEALFTQKKQRQQ